LRIRLWVACLAGAVVSVAGTVWAITTRSGPEGGADLSLLFSALAATGGLGLLVGAAFALWLDRVMVAHLRGLIAGVGSGQVTELRGLPAASGWGELSQLTQMIQMLITHQRQASRAVEELSMMRQQIARLRDRQERWIESERWPEVTPEPGPLLPVVESLNRGLKRLDEVREQNLEAAHQVSRELGRALEDARETAEQAEQGFVEATALLTTVRELQRLTIELTQTMEPVAAGRHDTFASTLAAWHQAARAAIEELVDSSTTSVEHLTRGVLKVQDITEQVHRITQRSTLIALHAATAPAAELDPELREHVHRLAAEVQDATELTTRLATDVQADVTAASARMRGVRERVAGRLDSAPALPAAAELPAPETARVLDRLREMIQDATRKSERLSATGERVSRSADRLVHGLEEESSEIAGLAARLAPPEPPVVPAPAVTPLPASETTRLGLKLLDPESSSGPPSRRGEGEERR
jgi:methyl-accepting chemotaxis protein